MVFMGYLLWADFELKNRVYKHHAINFQIETHQIFSYTTGFHYQLLYEQKHIYIQINHVQGHKHIQMHRKHRQIISGKWKARTVIALMKMFNKVIVTLQTAFLAMVDTQVTSISWP